MTALVANIAIGARAFKAAEGRFGDADGVSDPIFYVSNKVCDGYLLNNGIVELEDAEVVGLLLGLRASFEMFVDAPEDRLQEILSFDTRTAKISLDPARRLSLASASYHILDFMECHIPNRLLKLWIDERRDASREIMEETVMRMENTNGEQGH